MVIKRAILKTLMIIDPADIAMTAQALSSIRIIGKSKKSAGHYRKICHRLRKEMRILMSLMPMDSSVRIDAVKRAKRIMRRH